ncbi:MAG: hypothetical protein JWM04_1619 [Verrucomicrobiales bacterium]|jgi:hypothetical protein|nr:hypothetical protein [Verrucomicrobiales bacterium]
MKLPSRSVTFIRICLFAVNLAIQAAPETVQPDKDHGPLYRLVNKTDKFSDAECFWSLDNGREWHSFAKDPTVPCPHGNGRLYFRLGTAPQNFDDRNSYWDFIEYASENSETWHGNTTQVDAFCIPITIEMGDKKVGITESRRTLFEQFRTQAPEPFKGCAKGDWWVLSPCRATFGVNGANAHYFDSYIDEVWTMYAQERKTPSGKWIGKVVNDALTFTPVGEGRPISCSRKPSTQDAFLGTGVLATNAPFCAAINRHVLADPADWRNTEKFYQAQPCNWYAKFFHEHSLGHKAYGFCYDDFAEQAAFFSGKGKEVVITLRWDSLPKEK